MQTKTANASQVITPESDESELIDGLLRGDDTAWREFMRRYDPFLRNEARKTIAWAMRQVLPNDAIDDVMGDFYLSILNHDKKKLRTWADSTRTARLPSWLRMIIYQTATDHVRAAMRRFQTRGAVREDINAGVSDENWGEAWLDVKDEIKDRERASARVGRKKPKRRARKSR